MTPFHIYIDAYNIAFASYFALNGVGGNKPRLDTTPEIATCYGFLKTMLAQMKTYPMYSAVYVVFDNKDKDNPGWRYQLYPEYKANRSKHKTPESAEKSLQTSRVVMHAVDIIKTLCKVLPVFIVERYNTEGDDMIAVYRWAYRDVPAVIISGDKDLRQLVCPSISVYSPNSGKEITLTSFANHHSVKDSHKEVYQILNPESWLWFRILTGDSSDGIKGVTGIGAVTAAKLLLTATSIVNSRNMEGVTTPGDYLMANAAEVAVQSGVRGAASIAKKLMCAEGKEIVTRNMALMDLSLASRTIAEIPSLDDTLTMGVFDRGHFWQWLHEARMNTVIQQFEHFDNANTRLQNTR